MATSLAQGLVYDVNPSDPNAVPVVVANFGNNTTPSGITESICVKSSDAIMLLYIQ